MVRGIGIPSKFSENDQSLDLLIQKRYMIFHFWLGHLTKMSLATACNLKQLGCVHHHKNGIRSLWRILPFRQRTRNDLRSRVANDHFTLRSKVSIVFFFFFRLKTKCILTNGSLYLVLTFKLKNQLGIKICIVTKIMNEN